MTRPARRAIRIAAVLSDLAMLAALFGGVVAFIRIGALMGWGF